MILPSRSIHKELNITFMLGFITLIDVDDHSSLVIRPRIDQGVFIKTKTLLCIWCWIVHFLHIHNVITFVQPMTSILALNSSSKRFMMQL